MNALEHIAAKLAKLSGAIGGWRIDDAAGLGDIISVLDGCEELLDEAAAALRRQSAEVAWQPIATAPEDGTAILGYGRHTGSPPDAQRGVKAGDHWWAIMVWDIWRRSDAPGWGKQSKWVFAKDGKPTWSYPTHWMPLPAAPGSTPTQETEK